MVPTSDPIAAQRFPYPAKVNPINEDEYTSKNDSVKNTFEYNFHAMSNQKDAEEKMLTHVGMAKEMVLLRKTAYPMICPSSRQK